jgi:hypothetical protein
MSKKEGNKSFQLLAVRFTTMSFYSTSRICCPFFPQPPSHMSHQNFYKFGFRVSGTEKVCFLHHQVFDSLSL